MTAEMSRGAQLRAALSKFRETKRHGKYPEELRVRAVEYSTDRRRAGASVAEIAAELGVRDLTARTWASEVKRVGASSSAAVPASPGLSLIPVVVRPQSVPARPTRLEIELPDGTRLTVSGLSGSELAEAVESLRRMG